MNKKRLSRLVIVVPGVLLAMAVTPLAQAEDRPQGRAALRDRAVAKSVSLEREAERRGVPMRIETLTGESAWLSGFDGSRPIYDAPLAHSSAVSINFHHVREDFPVTASNNELIVGVWDSGSVRPDHPELIGRVTNFEETPHTISDHATASAGVIASTGVDPAGRGMMPLINVHAYDLKDDLVEMTERAAVGPVPVGDANLYVSNHSYGEFVGWAQARIEVEPDVFWQGWYWFGQWPEREDRRFGQYTERARDWDALCHASPYYLPVRAGGNDRTEGQLNNGAQFRYWDETTETWVLKSFNSETDPFPDNWNDGGFDTIGSFANAKNILNVGAVTYAISMNDRLAESSRMTPFSSWGPSDDGRIKPDVVASGEDVMLLWGTDPFFYASGSGTSFSAPAAAGAALFLQALHFEYANEAMISSAVKALLIHTATDIGNPGPDYKHGWGLIDVLAAAETLDKHLREGDTGIVHDEVLAEEATYTHTFYWDGFSPIRATLCWTDPPGPILSGLNDPTPVLVNDLDLRILAPDGETLHAPFLLDVANPSNLATTGDNIVDNVEQVLISSPVEGEYTLTITHKGTLEGGAQRFSLVLTGQELPGLNVSPNERQNARLVVGDEPPQFTWLLKNPSESAMPWQVESAPDWLLFDVETGTISGSGSLLVTATVDPLAPSLELGLQDGRVVFAESLESSKRVRRVALDHWLPISPGHVDDFESGELADTWRLTGVGQPRATVRDILAPIDSWHLILDDYMLGAARSRVEVTTLLEAAGWTDLELSFHAKAYHGPSIGPHTNPYLGGSSSTGVAISDDGHLWHEVLPLRVPGITTSYSPRNLDLSGALDATGLSGADHIFVRFSTHLRNPIESPTSPSGLFIDNFSIIGIQAAKDTWGIY